MYIKQMVEQYPTLACCQNALEEAVQTIINCYRAGGKVLICGNGGSAADSEHIAGELLKGFLKKRPLTPAQREALGDPLADMLQQGLPAVSLVSQTGVLTAIVNDLGGEAVFAQQIMALGKPGDVLIALSTSGNAKNTVNAVKAAAMLGMKTIALTGQSDSALKQSCDHWIAVPATCTPAVQEYHLPIYHALCAQVEAAFFNE